MGAASKQTSLNRAGRLVLITIAVGWFASALFAQSVGPAARPAGGSAKSYQQTTDDYNQRLTEIDKGLTSAQPGGWPDNSSADYQIGPDDQLDIAVFEAPELGRTLRVSESGEISLPLVGTVRAAGLTTRELETVIEELLRRNYIKDPHVSVQVGEMQSHPVAVFGAVKKPGVFQIREPKTVVELLSMAEGLAPDAGNTVIVEHRGNAPGLVAAASGAGSVAPSGAKKVSGQSASPQKGSDKVENPAKDADRPAAKLAPDAATPVGAARASRTVAIDLKKLLNTGDRGLNVLVYPGDVVKVPRAELVYVVGEVGKPGGFELKTNESVSVLQAIALAQGLTRTSASSRSRIIRTDPVTGERQEIPINVRQILAGKIADPMLQPRDIVFVPNSAGRAALYQGVGTAMSIGTGVAVYRW